MIHQSVLVQAVIVQQNGLMINLTDAIEIRLKQYYQSNIESLLLNDLSYWCKQNLRPCNEICSLSLSGEFQTLSFTHPDEC